MSQEFVMFGMGVVVGMIATSGLQQVWGALMEALESGKEKKRTDAEREAIRERILEDQERIEKEQEWRKMKLAWSKERKSGRVAVVEKYWKSGGEKGYIVDCAKVLLERGIL